MKFEGSGSKGTRVIERKQSVTDGQTDRRTNGQTDKAKTICLPHKYQYETKIWEHLYGCLKQVGCLIKVTANWGLTVTTQ